MDIKNYNQLEKIFLQEVQIRPESIGHFELSKNGSGKKICKAVLTGSAESDGIYLLSEIIRIIEKEKLHV